MNSPTSPPNALIRPSRILLNMILLTPGTFVRNLIIGLSSIGLILDLKIFSITSGTVMSW